MYDRERDRIKQGRQQVGRDESGGDGDADRIGKVRVLGIQDEHGWGIVHRIRGDRAERKAAGGKQGGGGIRRRAAADGDGEQRFFHAFINHRHRRRRSDQCRGIDHAQGQNLRRGLTTAVGKRDDHINRQSDRVIPQLRRAKAAQIEDFAVGGKAQIGRRFARVLPFKQIRVDVI